MLRGFRGSDVVFKAIPFVELIGGARGNYYFPGYERVISSTIFLQRTAGGWNFLVGGAFRRGGSRRRVAALALLLGLGAVRRHPPSELVPFSVTVCIAM